MSTTLILPTKDEASNILPLLQKVHRYVDQVIVVDDSSRDGTASLARSFGRNVFVIERKNALGLSSAITTGVIAASTENIIVMDADFSHPPELVPVLRDSLNYYDLVIATRESVENWPIHRRLMSLGARFLVRVHVPRIRDPLSGFFGIKRDIIAKYGRKAPPDGYKILYTILKHYIAERGLRGIAEVGYHFNGRQRGNSKLGRRQVVAFLRNWLFS